MRSLPRRLTIAGALFVVGCGKHEASPGAAATASSASNRVSVEVHPAASTPSASVAAPAFPSASASASAASASAIELAAAIVGTWRFSGFDQRDPATKAFWTSLAPAQQGEVIMEASKATLYITPSELVTKLAADESRVAYTVEPAEGGDALVLKTKEGRKLVRFADARRTVLRVVELDNPRAPVAFFARMSAARR